MKKIRFIITKMFENRVDGYCEMLGGASYDEKDCNIKIETKKVPFYYEFESNTIWVSEKVTIGEALFIAREFKDKCYGEIWAKLKYEEKIYDL